MIEINNLSIFFIRKISKGLLQDSKLSLIVSNLLLQLENIRGPMRSPPRKHIDKIHSIKRIDLGNNRNSVLEKMIRVNKAIKAEETVIARNIFT
jgi:hypothetical protein